MLLDLRSLVETPASTGAATFDVTAAQGAGGVRVPTNLILGGRAGYAEAIIARRVIADQPLRIGGTGGAAFSVTAAEGFQWDLDLLHAEEELLMQLVTAALIGSDR